MDLRTKHLKLYVREVFGDDQVDLFRFSWRSLEERIDFAAYHLAEMKRVVLPYTAGIGPQPGLDRVFGSAMGEARTHVIACLQSLHAIGDICAHGVYYGLGANLAGPPMADKRIDASSVPTVIQNAGPASAFSELVEHPNFHYLRDVVNRSKHCSVVSTNYTFEVLRDNQEKGWHGVALWRFEHHGRAYPVRRAEEFLAGEIDRQEAALELIAKELEAVVKEKWDQLKLKHGRAWPPRHVSEENEEP